MDPLEERNAELERENGQLLAALHEAQADIERWTAKYEELKKMKKEGPYPNYHGNLE